MIAIAMEMTTQITYIENEEEEHWPQGGRRMSVTNTQQQGRRQELGARNSEAEAEGRRRQTAKGKGKRQIKHKA
jgi:hypothetical protein